jgi:hypothetical protein
MIAVTFMLRLALKSSETVAPLERTKGKLKYVAERDF